MAQLGIAITSFLKEWRGNSDYIHAHTSGSTGKPKDILLSKTLVADSARRTIKFFGLNKESRLHLCLSTDYIAGKMMVVRAELCGAILTAEAPSNTPLADDVRHHGPRISLLALVPSQLQSLLENPHRLANVDNILLGGSSIPEAVRQRLFAMNLPVKVWESYGMTETASHIALRPVVPSLPPFTCLEGISVYEGAEGNLCISLPEGPVIATRDVAEILSAHSFRIRGRLDNVIISGGVKIHPEELEAKAADLLAGYLCFIGAVPDEKWGQMAVLVIEDRNKISSAIKEQLICNLRNQLGTIYAPKKIISVPRILKTDSGKIIRRINFS